MGCCLKVLRLKESYGEEGMCWGSEQKVRIDARKLYKDVGAVAIRCHSISS